MRVMRTTRDFVNLRKGRNEWYTIRNSASGSASEIMIYDEIGFFGVTANDFVRDLAQVDGDVTLHLNTPGGEVFDGITIYNALLNREGTVRVVIDGLAASVGSVIAMAASPGELAIAKRAEMMIHDGFSMAVGNASDMRALADQLDQQSDNIAGIYSDRTGKDAAYWRQLMREETWYIGQEAVDVGLVDRVVGQEKVENSWDLSIFNHRCTTDARNMVTLTAASYSHAPMTGEHQHAHPAFGSQGDDGSHEHAHTHNNDADHNHDHSDPDNDGDDDSTPAGDTDHDYAGKPSNKLQAAAKESHAAVNYREGTPAECCATCSMSSVSGGQMHCSLVVDPIRPDGYCDEYEEKSAGNAPTDEIDPGLLRATLLSGLEENNR